MDTEILIRKAERNDAAALERISVDTFLEAFAAQNTKEDMDIFLQQCFTKQAIETEIDDPATNYHLAYRNNELVGYIKLRKAPPESTDIESGLEVARIYVYKKYKRMGIGSALIKFAIDYANKDGIKIIWLGVWEFNPDAIWFYERWGFKVYGKHIFMLGKDQQNDFLMMKHL